MSQEIKSSVLTTEEIMLAGAGIAVVGTAVIVGKALASGVFVGLITAAGATYTIHKTRKHCPRIWNAICDRPLTADLVLDAGVFILVGSAGVTGVVAGATASLFTSIGLCGLRKLGKVEVEPVGLFNCFKKKPVTIEVIYLKNGM